MLAIQTILLILIISTIIVNFIPNKYHKTIITISTVAIILDVIAFLLIAF